MQSQRSIIVKLLYVEASFRDPTHKFQGLFDRPGNHGPFTDLNDGALQQLGMLYHRVYQLVVRSVVTQTQFLEHGFLLPDSIDRSEPRFLQQVPQFWFGQRLDEVVNLVVIDAVFTKQRSQIAAGRSGRFFVNDYLVHIFVTIINKAYATKNKVRSRPLTQNSRSIRSYHRAGFR